MKLWDLVLYLDRHWVVRRYDPKRTRSATLIDSMGVQEDVAFNLDSSGNVKVLSNPPETWPFISVPVKPRKGRVIAVLRPVGQTPVSLVRFVDWMPADPVNSGGAVFLSPDLGLRMGDTVLVQYEDKTFARVTIPSSFGTVKQRTDKATPKTKPAQRTAYTQLLDDDRTIGEDE